MPTNPWLRCTSNTPLSVQEAVFLEFGHLFLLTPLGISGWHSTPSLGGAGTQPGAVEHPQGHRGHLLQDITFLHDAVVEAPGDTGGVCPEAAALLCALPGLDAGVAAVYPGVRIAGTHFLHCVKRKKKKKQQRKEGECVTSCSVCLVM